MKKVLRFVLILVIAIIAAVCILGLIEPNDVTVTRSTLIKAPKEAVFEQIVMFKNWPHWSPWYQMEPTVALTYSGTDGQPGSSYNWVGKKTGQGEMKNLAVNGTKLDFMVSFLKPFKSEAKGILEATDTAGMTKATWTFSSHSPFPMNAMMAFMNMDKMLGKDFENGLANMKAYVEANPSVSAGAVEIKEVNFPAHVYQGIRKVIGWNEMDKFFGDAYGALAKDLGPKISGVAVDICYKWDTALKQADMVAAFPVADTTTKIKGAAIFNVGASKAYMAVHKGGYGNMMVEHNALMKHVMGAGKTMTLALEEMVVGKPEPDSTKWVTNIYYLVN